MTSTCKSQQNPRSWLQYTRGYHNLVYHWLGHHQVNTHSLPMPPIGRWNCRMDETVQSLAHSSNQDVIHNLVSLLKLRVTYEREYEPIQIKVQKSQLSEDHLKWWLNKLDLSLFFNGTNGLQSRQFINISTHQEVFVVSSISLAARSISGIFR